jgi:hypothetical protein
MLPVHNLSCEDYEVSVRADAADLDAILATPVFVAFLAALADARTARAAYKAAKPLVDEAVLAEERDRSARLESTPEGLAFCAADNAHDESSDACSLAGEALSWAEARDAINRLLGRDAEPLADEARRLFDAAISANNDVLTELRRARRAFDAVCVEAHEAHQQARASLGARYRELRDADQRLREAAKPLEHVVCVHGRHW